MVWKFMRKLLVVMMGLVILILFEVQANELSFTFFHPSSLPPLELDSNYGTIDSCLEKKFVSCGEKLKKGDIMPFTGCIIQSFIICSMNEKYHDDPIFDTIMLEFHSCQKINFTDFGIAKCFFEWQQKYEKALRISFIHRIQDLAPGLDKVKSF